MKVRLPMFTVIYIDDFNKKHITVARNMIEFNFLKSRFIVIEYDLIKRR